MKSFLFCTCYINNDKFNHQSFRYKKWIDYYSALTNLQYDYIFLIDDGSLYIDLLENQDVNIFVSTNDSLPEELSSKINIISFENNLGRSSLLEHSGWWRSFTFALRIALKYDFTKIIHIESDFYILSDEIKNFINNKKSGWTSVYSECYNFPETSLQIICSDSYDRFEKIFKQVRALHFNVNQYAEFYLPFTSVDKQFKGDRIGEPEVLDHWSRKNENGKAFDYIGQLPINMKVPTSIKIRRLLNYMKNIEFQNQQEKQNRIFEYLNNNYYLI
jgi:hypothetical protein